MTEDQRSAALRANLATYESFDEKRYINGAPHIKHVSIGRIYGTMIDRAISSIAKDVSQIEVLELGAGSGLASTAWFTKKVRFTAVDSSESMLKDLLEKAKHYGVTPATVTADAEEFLASSSDSYDIVTHVSMLHHVPDYLSLLARSTTHIRQGGCLISFQDPLRYDRLPRHHHLLDRAAYFTWRLGQGNLRRGLRTRWRRLRGVYSPSEVVDFDEYHVVRNGVDSERIVELLELSFSTVEVISYWSTYSSLLQSLGERMKLRSGFGVLASGRKGS
jgi:2-polyprenyl-6-hydroxyphenyl methylase / 3-demethylubiquinone-9 3-methyltransferase